MSFRLFLATGWLVLLCVTIQAIAHMGAGAAGAVFIGDFAHPWRAQFDTDFSLHLLLIAAWMIFRAQSWLAGLICAALAVLLGGLFTLAYIGMLTALTKGDMSQVMTGKA